MLKKEIRVIGIDDSAFSKSQKSKVLVVGVVMRGGSWVDGILSTKVKIDGNDSTDKIINMINNCRFKTQLRCIFLNGIAVAGFNVIDIEKLNKETGIPVIVIIRKNPDIETIKETLIKINKTHENQIFSGHQKSDECERVQQAHSQVTGFFSGQKIKLIERAGNVMKIGEIFVQLKGIDLEKARKILKLTCTRSFIPEPLRLAHLVGTGIVTGESKGRA